MPDLIHTICILRLLVSSLPEDVFRGEPSWRMARTRRTLSIRKAHTPTTRKTSPRRFLRPAGTARAVRVVPERDESLLRATILAGGSGSAVGAVSGRGRAAVSRKVGG